jgi:hypothetical protein
MSFTRLDYDGCAYAKELQESTSPLEYLLYKGKYENCTNCPDYTNTIKFGPKADIESELRNQTRFTSKCPSNKYDPTKPFISTRTTNPVRCDRIESGLKKPTGPGYDPTNLGNNSCYK